MKMTKRLVALLGALALLGAASACGSDDGDATATGDAPDAEQEATRDDDGPDVDETDDDGDDNGDVEVGGGEFTGSFEECMEITGAMMSLLFLPMAGMFGIEEDELDELEQEMAQFGGSVPDEIADDFEVLMSAFDSFLSELEGLDLEDGMGMFDPEVGERMEAAAEGLDSPEVEQAGENIEAFLDEACDFEGMDPFDMDPGDLGLDMEMDF